MQKSKALANQYKLRPSRVGFPSITMCPFITQLCYNKSAEALFVMPLSFGIFLGSSYIPSRPSRPSPFDEMGLSHSMR